jgi:hypothetical protein
MEYLSSLRRLSSHLLSPGHGFNGLVVALMQEFIINFQAQLVILFVNGNGILSNVIESDLKTFESALRCKINNKMLNCNEFRNQYRVTNNIRMDFNIDLQHDKNLFFIKEQLKNVNNVVIFNNKSRSLNAEIYFQSGLSKQQDNKLNQFFFVLNRLLDEHNDINIKDLKDIILSSKYFHGFSIKDNKIDIKVIEMFDRWELNLTRAIKSFLYLQNFYLSFLVAYDDNGKFLFRHFPLTKIFQKIKDKHQKKEFLEDITFKWEPESYEGGFSAYTSIVRCPDYYPNWKNLSQARYSSDWIKFENEIFEGKNAIYIPVVSDGYASPIIQITTDETPSTEVLKSLYNLVMQVSSIPTIGWFPAFKLLLNNGGSKMNRQRESLYDKLIKSWS